MVSTTAITTCFLTIPQFPRFTTIPGSGTVGITYVYAPTNTDWVGGTSCGVSYAKYPTYDPLVLPYPTPTYVKCSFPTKVGSFPVVITPFIVHKSLGAVMANITLCDTIPAESINAQKFSIRCPSVIGKNLYTSGANTFSFRGPQGGPSIAPYAFEVRAPTTRTTYIEDKTKAKTTIQPTTILTASTTTTVTYSGSLSTQWIRVTTGTTTYTCTVTATSGTILGRSEPTGISENTVNIDEVQGDQVVDLNVIDEEYPEPTVANDDLPFSSSNSSNIIVEEESIELKERTPGELVEVVKRAQSIGKPNYTYPPVPVSTIYVTAFSTSTFTCTKYAQTIVNPPPVLTTISVLGYAQVTVTVQPSSSSPAALVASPLAQKASASVSRIS